MAASSNNVSPQRMLFAGQDIHVTDATLNDSGALLVVAFPARTDRQSLNLPGFGRDFFQSRQISSLLVTVRNNHWFQCEESAGFVDAIRRVSRKYQRVVTYGSSMGGYAALLFAKPLGADAAIALSPQISIDRSRVPWETRWGAEAAALHFRWDDMAGSLRDSTAKATLIYDPRGPDRRHAEEILALTRHARSVVVPFGGHPVGRYLRDAGLLGEAIEGLIRGTLQEASVRAAIRAQRRESAIYWIGLAHARHLRRRPDALEAANRAILLAPGDAAVQFFYARLCARMAHWEAALAAAEKAVSLAPKVPKFRIQCERIRVGRDQHDARQARESQVRPGMR